MSGRPDQALEVLSPEDLTAVVERLTLAARALVSGGAAGVVRGLGVSADDLVQETMRRFWDPSTSVKWRSEFGEPTVTTVCAFLKRVLTNHFLDLLKTAAYRHTSPDPAPEGDGPADGDDDEVAPQSSPAPRPNRIYLHAYLEQLYERTRSLAEDEDDVEVVFYLDLQVRGGGPYPNAEAAVQLGVSAAEIVNIRKRLARLVLRVRGHSGSSGPLQNAGAGATHVKEV